MATLTGKKINTTYDGLLKTEDNQPISTTKKKVTDGYGNETGLSVDNLGNVDVSDDLNVLGNAVVTGSTTANSFIKTGGTSSQFLKADGSLDSNTYITSEADTLDSVTDRGNATPNAISVGNLTAVNTTVESIEINYSLKDQVNSTGSANDILTSTGTATSWQSKSDLSLIDGSGTANKLPKFTDSDTIGNSIVTDNGTGVGINNSNPTEILEVYRAADNSRFKIQNNTFASWVGNDATGFAIETNLFKPIVFKPSGVTAMTLDSSGNVTLNNNLSIGGTLIDSNSSSGTSGQILSSTGTGTDWVSLSEISGVDGSGTTNYVPKWTDADTIGNSVIYDDGTNIGIGTATPSEKLEVTGTILIDTISSVTNAGLEISTANNRSGRILFNDSDASSQGRLVYDHSTDSMEFFTLSTERMRIDSAGNVGIGTSSPSKRFHVNSGNTNDVALFESTDSFANIYLKDNSGEMTLQKVGTDVLFVTENSSTHGNLRFLSNSGTERMRITSGGLLRVNTIYEDGVVNFANAPSKSVLALRDTAANGTQIRFYSFEGGLVGTITNTSSATSYNTSSDYRLKEDWQPMANALDRVEALKPINFAWKADGSRVDGFLAHELAEVIPEAVTGEKDATEEYEIPAVLDEEGNVIEEATTGVRDVYQGIDQSKIVPLLVAAIQELKGLVQSQQAEIELLKTK